MGSALGQSGAAEWLKAGDAKDQPGADRSVDHGRGPAANDEVYKPAQRTNEAANKPIITGKTANLRDEVKRRDMTARGQAYSGRDPDAEYSLKDADVGDALDAQVRKRQRRGHRGRRSFLWFNFNYEAGFDAAAKYKNFFGGLEPVFD